MRRIRRSCIALGVVTLASTLWLLPLGRASLMIGSCSIAPAQLGEITARGTCPDILATTPCPPESFCRDNGCKGTPYNPRNECLTDCRSYCFSECDSQSNGDLELFNECYENCTEQYCPLVCGQEPNELVLDCVRTINPDKQKEMQSYDPAISDADKSGYTFVSSSGVYCATSCQCSTYCFSVGVNQYECGTLGGNERNGEECAPVDFVYDADQSKSTPGTCPPSE